KLENLVDSGASLYLPSPESLTWNQMSILISFAASRKHGHCNPVSGGMNLSMTLPPSLGSHIRCHFMQPSLLQGT
ncbi:hypothetical protein A2U01_0032186, partial [Trifolium medium]|nr:hypothetical protein [Trifolium medium]